MKKIKKTSSREGGVSILNQGLCGGFHNKHARISGVKAKSTSKTTREYRLIRFNRGKARG
jgi:hypothetical protein